MTHEALRIAELEKLLHERNIEITYRNNELDVINSVQEALLQKMDMQSIYNMVGEKIREIFKVEVVYIAIRNSVNPNHIDFPYYVDRGERLNASHLTLGEGLTSKVIIDCKPLLIGTMDEQISMGVIFEADERANTYLGIPIIIGEFVAGVVSVQSYNQHAFSDSDVRLLSTLSSSMGAALENARLFDETNRLLKETEQRTTELAVINSVQEGLVAQMDMKSIYHLVGEKMREIFNAQVIDIVTYDATLQMIEDRYAYEKGDTTLLGPRKPKGFRRHVIDTGELLLVNKDSEKIRQKYDNSVLIGEGSKSAIFVPLMSVGKVSGIISLQNLDKENAFSDSDVNLLTTLANSMSVALESARLFDETTRLLKETEQRTRELSVINSVQEGLAGELDINGIYELVGEKMKEIFNAQVFDIATYDKTTQLLTDQYTFELGDRTLLPPRPLIGFRKWVIDHCQPLMINQNIDKVSKEFGNVVMTGEDTKSVVFVPIIIGNEPSGVMSLQHINENVFTEADVRLLTTLANSMSVALENARLFDETNRLLKETEQRTAELAVINSVQDGLAKELDIQAIYDLVGDRIIKVFNAPNLVIRTFDHETGQENWRYAIEKGERQYIEPKPFAWHSNRLIQTRKPIHINENYLQTSIKYGGSGIFIGQPSKSGIFAPMIVGDIVKGSISLQNVDIEHAYTDADLRLLTTITNSMSVALENARLFDETNRLLKETEQRTAELAIINSVQDGLASKLDIQAIYDLVGDKISDVFDSQGTAISFFDPKVNYITHPYYLFKGQRIFEDGFEFGKGLTSYVIKTGQPLLINENAIERYRELGTVYAAEESEEDTAKSWLGVPLISGGQINGTITLENYEKEFAYSDSDVTLLQTLANSISVALENARLFDETTLLLKETEQRTAELAVINGVQEGLAKELDIQGIYNLVGDRIQKLFNAQVVMIATFDHEREMENFNYHFEKGETIQPKPRNFDKVRKHLIETGQYILLNEDVPKAVAEFGVKVLPVPGTKMPKSILFMPLKVADKVTGYVSLQNIDIENAFSFSDVSLLSTLSNSMSVALENARLFDETNRLLKETEQRTGELAVINSVQEGLVREMDMHAIYELVGERLCNLFNIQTVVIRTFDHETGLEHWQYAKEKGEYQHVEPRPFNWNSKQLIMTKKPLDIKENYLETSKKYGGSGVTTGQPPKSAVFVPMIVGDEVKGSVSLQNVDVEHAFSESDLSLLTTLTNSMSVALENARLFDETNRLLKETEQRTSELAIINSVQEGLASKLDIQAIYDLVGDKIRDVFDTQGISLSFYDRQNNFITHPYYMFKGKQIEYFGYELGKGLTSHIIQTGQPLLINSNALQRFKELGAVFAESESEENTAKSWLGVPLVSGGLVNGTIRLENYEKEFAYTDSDVSLLQTLANSMSVALENARLFDETNRLLKETEQRTAELAVINSVQEGLAKELDIQGIYDLVGDRLCELFPDTQTLVIRTFDHETEMEHFNFAIEKGERFPIDSKPFIWASKHLIRDHKPIHINENYLETSQKYGGTGVTKGKPPKSAVFVPMLVGDTVKGSVSLQNVDKENAFSESDVRLLTTITNSMSVALENARLFDETTLLLSESKQRAAELSTVNNISKALAAQLDPADLIQMVGDQLKDLFNANIIYIALLNTKTKIVNFPYQYGDNMAPLILGEGLTSKIIQTGEPILINKDLGELRKKMGIQLIGVEAASYLGVPIPLGDENIGVLSVQSTEQENRFDENDMRLLTTIASSVGVALNNATLFEDVKVAKMEAEAASKAAERANEAKSAFLSTVSHELRTPLTSVLGFAKIIRKRLDERIFPAVDKTDSKTEKAIQQVSENLRVVISEGERLTHLINDVLDLAKIEAGKMEWNQENVSLPEVAERAIAATTSLFDQKALKLNKRIDNNLPEIIGDKDKLIQVIINLISNAVKFTDHGSVTCSVYREKNELIINISDTGIGIAPEDFGAVFEQFKQVGGDTLTDKPKGTGLGLPICKEIVEHHGGRIWLESEQGKGSSFLFALPVNKEKISDRPLHLNDLVNQLKHQVANSQISFIGQAAKILIVDDDDSIRSLLHQELGEAGYDIREAKDGKEALESVKSRRPDLIILDIMMPEMNGFDVAAVLKNDPDTMDIPIIVLSVVQDKARGFRIGVDRYLTKPIDTNILFNEIGSLLEQGKSRKRVMIVDDDTGAVEILREVLVSKGYEVTSSSEIELFEKAKNNQPDIIMINTALTEKHDIVQSLRLEKGMEKVLFVVYQ